MRTNLTVFRLGPHDSPGYFDQIARIHINEISSGFMLQLGNHFLETLYKCISQSKHSFLFAATSNHEAVGFICGSTNTRGLYLDYTVRYFPLVIPSLLPKLANLQTIRRVFETVLYPHRERSLQLPQSQILNFCVNSRLQRTGIGGQLFGSLVNEFHKRGISQIKMVTGSHQVSAQRFYERQGAQIAQHYEIHKGTESVIYVFSIPTDGVVK